MVSVRGGKTEQSGGLGNEAERAISVGRVSH